MVVIEIGNCHGPEVDKFAEFGLTAAKRGRKSSPFDRGMRNFECMLVDTSLVMAATSSSSVVKAQVATQPRHPKPFTIGVTECS